VAQRYPVGEIDLVALKGRRLVFIEVKRRKTKEDAAWTLPAAAPHRESRPILARRPSGLCRT
jgi:putative endonuclease